MMLACFGTCFGRRRRVDPSVGPRERGCLLTPEGIIDIGRQALILTLVIAGPPLLAGLAIGLLISIFQAVTQIQEFTLTFVPKILVVFVVLIIFMPWMLQMFLNFTTSLIIGIPDMVR